MSILGCQNKAWCLMKYTNSSVWERKRSMKFVVCSYNSKERKDNKWKSFKTNCLDPTVISTTYLHMKTDSKSIILNCNNLRILHLWIL